MTKNLVPSSSERVAQMTYFVRYKAPDRNLCWEPFSTVETANAFALAVMRAGFAGVSMSRQPRVA